MRRCEQAPKEPKTRRGACAARRGTHGRRPMTANGASQRGREGPAARSKTTAMGTTGLERFMRLLAGRRGCIAHGCHTRMACDVRRRHVSLFSPAARREGPAAHAPPLSAAHSARKAPSTARRELAPSSGVVAPGLLLLRPKGDAQRAHHLGNDLLVRNSLASLIVLHHLRQLVDSLREARRRRVSATGRGRGIDRGGVQHTPRRAAACLSQLRLRHLLLQTGLHDVGLQLAGHLVVCARGRGGGETRHAAEWRARRAPRAAARRARAGAHGAALPSQRPAWTPWPQDQRRCCSSPQRLAEAWKARVRAAQHLKPSPGRGIARVRATTRRRCVRRRV